MADDFYIDPLIREDYEAISALCNSDPGARRIVTIIVEYIENNPHRSMAEIAGSISRVLDRLQQRRVDEPLVEEHVPEESHN